ncbi:uncharacterized protein Z518_10640 [Rhinocladiella mackenziei CBS 650.93]|uniref:Thymocyte nuclear protein 1 n=1 Tax=Rhinocladiella mackenziei CBS 650.93 TaxID=1442369 RepID=A0A0D2IUY9_9EURO|nr:uncharacterized protein Z518_10640 [Rhinocladiella mackenziei CBS 650.93]KIX00500.1 hypothetical protein Z518_10640 [Rhinocladiella mackenziei CBS 650.93]
MPPKKRKASTAPAASSASSTSAKKARIDGTSNIPDPIPAPNRSLTGRPKRTSVSEPVYRLANRPSSTTAAQNDNAPPSAEVPVKRRGRPAKTTTTHPTTVSPAPASKKGTLENYGAASTTATPATVTANPRARSVIRQKTASVPAAKRGRKPKASASVHTGPARPISDSEDVSTTAVNENARKANVEDMEILDHGIQYWLMKAEPESRIEKGHDVKFSIDDLAARSEPEGWDGVRNPVARNNMRAMRKGDLAFFYHSNCAVPGVAGIMRIVAEHSVDESAFDPDHPYYDPKSDREKPKWELVHVEFVKRFDNFVTLKELKSFAKTGGALENMQMLKQSRLSVSSVRPEEWRFILNLAGEPTSLGRGAGKDRQESGVDGGEYDTTGTGDGDVDGNSDAVNGLAGGVGLGITGADATGTSEMNFKAHRQWKRP